MTAPELGSHDPRRRQDGLGWVTSALFPDPRVELHVSAARSQPRLPPGHTRLPSYAIVPFASRPRFLVPLSSRRTAWRSLRAYNALRPPNVRAARAGLSVLARLGAFSLPTASRLTATAPADITRAEVDLAHHLSIELGVSGLAGACGIRPPDPNHKPTLQLFDPTGRVVGFAKVGWNDATRQLVAAEATALQSLDLSSPDHPIVPRVMLTTQWCGQSVVVVEPLPPGIRGVQSNDPVRVTETLVVARRGGPPTTPRPLAGSPFIERTQHAAASTAVRDVVGNRLAELTDRFVRLSGETAVEFGWWHGDWVPWNLGTVDGRLVAWDWEHSGPDIPVGADIAHDGFQRAFILQHLHLSTAVERANAQLARTSPRLGLSPPQRRVVLVAYLIEMWLRAQRLAAGGGGWNPALHPGLLDEIERHLS